MIKINLSTAKKQVDISNLAGLDFTQINIKLLLLAIFLVYLPDFTIYPEWDAALEQTNQELTSKQMALSSLQRKVAQNQNFEKQIKDLKAQEENFGKKLLAVKEAISEKKNPSSLLLYISKNIPSPLWIDELTVDNNIMTVKGQSLDYTSIGNFITSLKSSVFIRDASIISTNSSVREADKKRIEAYEVKFTIGRFDQ